MTAYSAEIGVERRAISDTEIVSRCLLAMVNEGAKIVGEGLAYRPVDIDIIYQNGYGLPAERGGPMFQADLIGLPQILETIEGYAAGRNGWSWTPAPLLIELVERGEGTWGAQSMIAVTVGMLGSETITPSLLGKPGRNNTAMIQGTGA